MGRRHQLVDFLDAGLFAGEVKDYPANGQSAQSIHGRHLAVRDSSTTLLGKENGIHRGIVGDDGPGEQTSMSVRIEDGGSQIDEEPVASALPLTSS
jgi:hypothetical protein